MKRDLARQIFAKFSTFRKVLELWKPIIFVLIGINGILVWLFGISLQVNATRSQLFALPKPTPAWILALGPQPGESLPVTEARFGEAGSEDPFWPGYGVICAQVDGALAELDLDQLHSKVTLNLNGFNILEIVPEWLLQGVRPFKGFIFTSDAKDTNRGLNICWRMILESGEYLASIRILQDARTNLEYSWTFQLTGQ
jgi:hypothetical protein